MYVYLDNMYTVKCPMQFLVSTTHHVEEIEKQRSCEVLVKAHPATK